MGVDTDVNAGPELVHDQQTGAKVGCKWFIGSGVTGHDCYGGPITDMTVSMAILDAASTSQSAMVQAMPGPMAAWFVAHKTVEKTRFWERCRFHDGWK